jgi:hypothetical protein
MDATVIILQVHWFTVLPRNGHCMKYTIFLSGNLEKKPLVAVYAPSAKARD